MSGYSQRTTVRIKIHGLREHLDPTKPKLSDIMHSCAVEALSYPPGKRFYRFFPPDAEDFHYPTNRPPRYTIVEIGMFEGRSVEAE